MIKVRQLKSGDRFMWKDDVAVVSDITNITDHFFSVDGRMMYSLELKVPSKEWVGAVQVDGDTEVRKVD